MAPAYRPDFALNTPWVKDWQPELVGTLLFVVRTLAASSVAQEVLLIHKKSGHGQGKINGPGGKLERGETAMTGAIRELQEETGVVVESARCAAELRFVERNGPQWLGYAFVASQHVGTPISTQEADPFWCEVEKIPYDKMWPDDALWLPNVLANTPGSAAPPLVGNFLFDDEHLLAHDLAHTRLAPTAWREHFGVC